MSTTLDDLLGKVVEVRPADRREFIYSLNRKDLEMLQKYLQDHQHLRQSSLLTTTLELVNERVGS